MATFPDCEGRSGYYCVEDPAVVVADDVHIYAGGGKCKKQQVNIEIWLLGLFQKYKKWKVDLNPFNW